MEKLGYAESISRKGNTGEIKTNAGRFVMPLEVLDLYLDSEHQTIRSNFGHLLAYPLARATIPDSYAARPDSYARINSSEEKLKRSASLDQKIRKWIAKNHINPREVLSEYHEGTDKTDQLLSLVTPDILEALAKDRIFFHFSTHPSDREDYTWIDHNAIAGSATISFGNPFMSTAFKADKDWQKEARVKRAELMAPGKYLTNPKGLIPFTKGNNENYAYGGKVSHVFTFPAENAMQALGRSLAEFYGTTSSIQKTPEAPLNFESIDYVRVVLENEQYDKDMVAYGKPVSLDFMLDKKVVASSTHPEVLLRIKPKEEDVALMDTLTDKNGRKHYIGRKTEEFTHTLSELPFALPFFEAYALRLAEELRPLSYP